MNGYFFEKVSNESDKWKVARRQAFEELLPVLLLARERIISIDNGDCFDAVLALEEAISKAKS